jgi:archaellum biogenesis ATPase FlaH
MNRNSDNSIDLNRLQVDSLPDNLGDNSTVLLASAGDPTQYAICLRILLQYGTTGDTALIVTTTESADQTIDTYEHLETDVNHLSLGIVDTISEQQSVSALYGETPVVFTPSSGDLERLVLALSELSDTTPSSNRARHLVMRSITPIVNSAPITRVCTVLERITGLHSENGLSLLGLDYTTHEEETITAIAAHVDAILWVTHSSSDRLTFDYQSTRSHYNRPAFSRNTDT